VVTNSHTHITGQGWEPCAPSDPGAKPLSLQYFADNNLADKVLPPKITMRDFEKVREGGKTGRAGGPQCAAVCVRIGM
jgi:hypothetical protein